MKPTSALLTTAFLAAVVLFWAPGVEAQNTPASTVTTADLTAFMDKWKPIWKEKGLFGLGPMFEETNALALILAANEREPEGPWCWALQLRFRPESMKGAEAAEAHDAWKQAHAVLAAAADKSPGNPELQHNLRMTQKNLAEACLALDKDLPIVRQLADRLLQRAAANTNDWDHGNLVYDGHSLLGRLALREGKPEEARKEVLNAGQTRGSPQLNSFGPTFVLARELLQHGEKEDREAVIAFLEEIARFWANPDKVAEYRKADTVKKRQDIENWKDDIRAGRIPTHPKWR